VPVAGWAATAGKAGRQGLRWADEAAEFGSRHIDDVSMPKGQRVLAYGGGGGSSGYRFVSAQGHLVPVPKNWVAKAAKKGKGIVYQRPGAVGNAYTIRIMEPTSQYPQGYVRYYNQYGQPLDISGKPGNRASTHIPLDYIGLIPGWPQ